MEATPAVEKSGLVGRIPVRNLWLLMFYASDLSHVCGKGPGGQENSPDDLPALVAGLLADAVEKRIRRALGVGYRQRAALTSRVRGRIDVLVTESHQLMARGQIACHFDELTVDTPHNRAVRLALEHAARLLVHGVPTDRLLRSGHQVQPGSITTESHAGLATRCRMLAGRMREMGVGVAPGIAQARMQLDGQRPGRNDGEDRLMVSAARLLLWMLLPAEHGGTMLLARVDRDEVWVRKLFEQAVGGFYRTALVPRGWQVRCGTRLGWQIEAVTPGMKSILPGMKTDIVLDHPSSGRRIVMDTKFTSIVKLGQYGGETLRSGYVYQIYAYLRSQVGQGDAMADTASGVMLHPAVGEMRDETVVIQGHAIRFVTVDLAASAADVRAQLLRCCDRFEKNRPPENSIPDGRSGLR